MNPTQSYFMRDVRRNEWKNNRIELDPYYSRKQHCIEAAAAFVCFALMLLILTLCGLAATYEQATTITPDAEAIKSAIKRQNEIQSTELYRHFQERSK